MLKSKKKKYVFLIFLFLLTIVCFGLFLVSYTAGLALILGIVLGLLAKRNFWLLVIFFYLFKNNLKKILIVFVVFLILTIFTYIYGEIIILFRSIHRQSPISNIPKDSEPSFTPSPTPSSLFFSIKTTYQVNIFFSKDFKILTTHETIELDNESKSFISTSLSDIEKELKSKKQKKQNNLKQLNLKKEYLYNFLFNRAIIKNKKVKVKVKNVGLILKLIDVQPLNSADSNCAILKNLIKKLIEKLCFEETSKTKIKLVKFPSGTFYEAYNSAGTSITNQGENMETINWELQDIEEGIKFAYLPYPYNVFNRYLKPFLIFTDVNKWLIVTIGGKAAFILKPLPKRIINTSGGNYNEYIQGAYIQGDYTNLSQEFSEASLQIHQLLMQLQNQGYSQEQAQQQVAQDLAKKAENNPTVLDKLVKWRQFLNNTAANTTVSEAAKEVFKIALKLLNISIT